VKRYERGFCKPEEELRKGEKISSQKEKKGPKKGGTYLWRTRKSIGTEKRELLKVRGKKEKKKRIHG